MSSIGVENQESLFNVYLNAKIVKIKDFDDLQKFGEAIIRIDEIHGDETKTPDDNLPAALFYARSHVESVGTFNVGDTVLVSFMGGNREAPVIEGKVVNLEEIGKVIPEYAEHYGDVKGMYSSKAECCFFFNEQSKTMVLRFNDGTTINITKEGWDQKTSKYNIEVNGPATIKAQSLVADIQGSAQIKAATANVEASGVLTLKGATIMEN